jgi:hypothetical protein
MIWRTAAPLDRRQQDAFVEAVMAALEGCSEFGEGTIYRVIRATQRFYWGDPSLPRTPRLP